MAKKKKSEPEAAIPEPRTVTSFEKGPDKEPEKLSELKAPDAAAAALHRSPSPAIVKPGAGPASASQPGADAPVTLAADVSLEGSANAPFIYFENAGVSGHMNGLVRVTLEANRLLPGENNKVFVDRIIVGHLRMNIPAAQSLRNALDRALLIASKPASREVN